MKVERQRHSRVSRLASSTRTWGRSGRTAWHHDTKLTSKGALKRTKVAYRIVLAGKGRSTVQIRMVDKGKKRTSVLAHVGVPVRFEVGDLVKKAEGVVVPSKGDKDVPSVAADSSSEYFALVERAVRTVSRGERRRWNGRHVWLGDGGWD